MVRTLLLKVHGEIAAIVSLDELQILIISQVKQRNEPDKESTSVVGIFTNTIQDRTLEDNIS
jgi:hypothetical protein